jgi:hypothetical protein
MSLRRARLETRAGLRPTSTRCSKSRSASVSAGREMYSWVGESRFEDRSLFQLVGSGALSTGSFASFLVVVFRDDQASFSYKGEITEGGMQLADFEFHVPCKAATISTAEQALTSRQGITAISLST